MDRVSAQRCDVRALHVRLCEEIAELHPRIVADVMRSFLEVSSLPCDRSLWSLEFAFDEDDGRIARLEARFAERGAPPISTDDLPGYEVQVLLPKVIPPHPHPPADGVRAATSAPAPGGLVARFVLALAELGAYRTIERLEARSAEVYLL